MVVIFDDIFLKLKRCGDFSNNGFTVYARIDIDYCLIIFFVPNNTSAGIVYIIAVPEIFVIKPVMSVGIVELACLFSSLGNLAGVIYQLASDVEKRTDFCHFNSPVALSELSVVAYLYFFAPFSRAHFILSRSDAGDVIST